MLTVFDLHKKCVAIFIRYFWICEFWRQVISGKNILGFWAYWSKSWSCCASKAAELPCWYFSLFLTCLQVLFLSFFSSYAIAFWFSFMIDLFIVSMITHVPIGVGLEWITTLVVFFLLHFHRGTWVGHTSQNKMHLMLYVLVDYMLYTVINWLIEHSIFLG